MKYKVGDEVKIVDEFKWHAQYGVFTKEAWTGKIMTIDFVNRTRGTYLMKEDNNKHIWFGDEIDGLVQDAKFKEKLTIYDTVKHKLYGIGTVICIEHDKFIGVDFDEYNPDLHYLDGKCEHGHGWWCNEHELEKVK